jgi:valyl-tRNA synthetase
MDPQYDHSKFENGIYKKWEESGAFKPQGKGKPFTIIMPPPNANDPLHIGHARFVAIEDVLIRYHRMKGEPTLWLPGSDHAGIETQFVFEKKLKEKGKSRFDYDRDTLYKMIRDYVQENTGVMESQLRKLGASSRSTRK